MTACEPEGTTDTPLFSVSGTFTKSGGAGTGDVKFNFASDASRSIVAANAISGVLEDGALTIRLSGTFDPDTLSYSVSAAASVIRYTINGAVDSDGNSLGATATLLVNSGGDNWQAFSFVVNESAVTISGTPQDSETGGVPAFAFGNWFFNQVLPDTSTREMRVLVNQWDLNIDNFYNNYDGTTNFFNTKVNIIEVTSNAGEYDILWSYPEYVATKEQTEAAIMQYLQHHNIPVTKKDNINDVVTGAWIYVENDGSTSWGGFTDPQWQVVYQFFSSNALLQYLLANSVPPVTKFEKVQVTFSNNNTNLILVPYWNGSSFGASSTLGEAKALTLLLNSQAITLTR